MDKKVEVRVGETSLEVLGEYDEELGSLIVTDVTLFVKISPEGQPALFKKVSVKDLLENLRDDQLEFVEALALEQIDHENYGRDEDEDEYFDDEDDDDDEEDFEEDE